MPKVMELPKLGVNMEKATIVEWAVSVGEKVELDQRLLDAETDKAVIEIPATVSGVLAKQVAAVGETVLCGEPVAVFVEEGESLDAADSGAVKGSAAPAKSEPVSALPPMPSESASALPPMPSESGSALPPMPAAKAPKPKAAGAGISRIRISPLARAEAKKLDIDLTRVKPAKPGARITKADVLAHADAQAKAPQAMEPLPVDRSLTVSNTIPMEGVRGVIAERLAYSAQSTARTMLFMTVDMSRMIAWRNELKEDGLKVGFNSLYVAIVAKALSEFCEFNSRINGGQIEQIAEINVGVAVDTARGLLVPVIRDADHKGVMAIEQDFMAKVERAKAAKSDMDDLSGGTFTLTNLGMFGVDAFIPVINPPECAILAMGTTVKTPLVDADDQIIIKPLTQLCLAWDHRITDGTPAARFLKRIKELIERPMGLMS